MKKDTVQRVREFNRFYTKIIGLLDRSILGSPFTLPEARLLFELYHAGPCTASVIIDSTGMDKGYVSRLIKIFLKKKLLTKVRDKSDGRSVWIELTSNGKAEFEKINKRSAFEISALLLKLNENQKAALVRHMAGIQEILGSPTSWHDGNT